jgi:very-short-patch-repair endonuclease
MPSGLIRSQKINSEKLKLAKWMRRHMTFAERCFWNAVKNDRFMNLHFRRQQVIHGFIADFYCEELNLVVEIDGGIHEQQKEYDRERQKIISDYGFIVIRFSNDEVIRNLDQVLKRLRDLTTAADST